MKRVDILEDISHITVHIPRDKRKLWSKIHFLKDAHKCDKHCLELHHIVISLDGYADETWWIPEIYFSMSELMYLRWFNIIDVNDLT